MDDLSRILGSLRIHDGLHFRNNQIHESNALMREFVHFTFHENEVPFKRLRRDLGFAERDDHVRQYSEFSPPPLPKNFNLDKWGYVQPCLPVQMKHLRLFNRQSQPMPPRYESHFRRAVAHVTELLTLDKKLPMPTRDTLKDTRYDATTFPGLEYARQGMNTRGEAHFTALLDAQQAWNSLSAGVRVRPHDTRLGGLGKLIEKTGPGGRVEADVQTSLGRLILMLSHRDLLILGALEQPLTKSYLEERWPIHIGNSWYHGGAERFVNRIANYSIYHCFDAKSFDASIDGWLVREALHILRRQYEDGMNPRYDTLWEFVYESLVDVIICRDDGLRMQKHVGTTSGNSFNSLVQSVITLLLGYTSLIVTAHERYFEFGVNLILTQSKIEVLGDDMVMALDVHWSYLSKEILAGVVKDCFHIDWSGRKSFTTQRLMDDDSTPAHERFKGVQFLGMYFRHLRLGTGPYAPKVVIPYRPFSESYMHLLFPKHGRLEVNDAWLRAIGIFLNGAGNPETLKWLNGYLDYLETKITEFPTAWPHSLGKWVAKDFWHLGNFVPLPRRISEQEWLQMACMPPRLIEE
ncbi:hypothetical protein MVEG_02662 [Podila verticillata NRRL 6337]|nr:hypothetical protein MVEG_02662 [Podila verticillata NRRL 6337]